jgi:hypothetical protein
MAVKGYRWISIGYSRKLFYPPYLGRPACRCILAVCALTIFKYSHTPCSWPLYPIIFIPLVLLWRGNLAPQYFSQVTFEGLLLGSLACWLSTQFFTGAVAAIELPAHGLLCVLVGLQFALIALALWSTSSWSIFWVAPFVGLLTAIIEFAQAVSLGITWVATNTALAVANSPLAQWSGTFTPFGLAAVLVCVGCLWPPTSCCSGWRQWLSVGRNMD